MNLYEEMLEFLRTRMLFADDLAPCMICSVGAHIANLAQAEKPFYGVMDIPEVINLPIVVVAPSGFSKSYLMKQFMQPVYGIMPFKSKFRGKITEAGFIGTLTPEGDVKRGDAWRFRDGILAFNEITNLFYAAEQSYSAELINQVMDALTESHVSKALGKGVIEYDTHITIWGGVRPMDFDFSQGLARRFLFVTRAWTSQDIQELKRIRMGSRKFKKLERVEIKEFRHDLNNLKLNLNIEEISFANDLDEYLFQISNSHLQMQMMERALIGKTTLEQGLKDKLSISMSESNKTLLEQIVKMHNLSAEGTELSLILSTLGDGEWTREKLWHYFRRYSYTYENFWELLKKAVRLGLVKREVDEHKNGTIDYIYSKTSRKKGQVKKDNTQTG